MSWEDADFVNASAKKKWDDETNDDVPDEWDASSESEKEEEKAPLPVSAKPKKAIDAAIEKREQKEQEERLAAAKKKALEATAPPKRDYSGLDAKTAEKLRLQDEVERADLKNAEDLFDGVGGKEKEVVLTLEQMMPKTEAEFTAFAEVAAATILRHSKSRQYPAFLRNFVKKLMEPMDSGDSKDLSSAVSVVYNDKVKKEREAAKGGKKKAPVKKSVSHVGSELEAYSESMDDNMDSFM